MDPRGRGLGHRGWRRAGLPSQPSQVTHSCCNLRSPVPDSFCKARPCKGTSENCTRVSVTCLLHQHITVLPNPDSGHVGPGRPKKGRSPPPRRERTQSRGHQTRRGYRLRHSSPAEWPGGGWGPQPPRSVGMVLPHRSSDVGPRAAHPPPATLLNSGLQNLLVRPPGVVTHLAGPLPLAS